MSSPTWAQRTDIHRELLMVMERGGRNVNNFPLLTHIRLRSQSSFAGMEPMKRNAGHPQEGMLSWHRLMHLHSSLSFFLGSVWFIIQLEQQTVYLLFILKHCCYPWDLIKTASIWDLLTFLFASPKLFQPLNQVQVSMSQFFIPFQKDAASNEFP